MSSGFTQHLRSSSRGPCHPWLSNRQESKKRTGRSSLHSCLQGFLSSVLWLQKKQVCVHIQEKVQSRSKNAKGGWTETFRKVVRVREDFKSSFGEYGWRMMQPSPAYWRLFHYPGLLHLHFELPQWRTQCIKKSVWPPCASPSSHISVALANDLSIVNVWRGMTILAPSFEDFSPPTAAMLVWDLWWSHTS